MKHQKQLDPRREDGGTRGKLRLSCGGWTKLQRKLIISRQLLNFSEIKVSMIATANSCLFILSINAIFISSLVIQLVVHVITCRPTCNKNLTARNP